jgi:hypothetical protein
MATGGGVDKAALDRNIFANAEIGTVAANSHFVRIADLTTYSFTHYSNRLDPKLTQHRFNYLHRST